jgi:hypothetical protein
MYEKAIMPGDTTVPEISINCIMDEGNKTRTKADIKRLGCLSNVNKQDKAHRLEAWAGILIFKSKTI